MTPKSFAYRVKKRWITNPKDVSATWKPGLAPVTTIVDFDKGLDAVARLAHKRKRAADLERANRAKRPKRTGKPRLPTFSFLKDEPK